jgi:glycosyltransferase involved in cell wall biosynthesis
MSAMRVLIDHPFPFALAHGGFQTQIEQTRQALQRIGVNADHLRWWDDAQHGEVIHHFGPASNAYLEQARIKGIPVIMTTLFTETCNRSDRRLGAQRLMTMGLLRLPFGEGVKQQLSWRAYHGCSQNVVGLKAEKHVLLKVFDVPAERVSIVPLGLPPAFLKAGAATRSLDHLICTGTITERKNCIELAEMARLAQTPLLFVGKPYSLKDPYWLRFQRLIDDRWVKYQTHVNSESEMIALLQQARGFVLMSNHENWCLSAHEAAACGLPLLVQNQKWSRERFGDQAHYFATIGNTPANIDILKTFYDQGPGLASPQIKLHSWEDAAIQLKGIYEAALRAS